MTIIKKERDFYQTTLKRDESMSVYFTKNQRDRSTSWASKSRLNMNRASPREKFNLLKASQ